MTTWVLIITLFMSNSTRGAVATSIQSVDFKTKASCMQAAQMWVGQINDVDAKSSWSRIRGKALCVPKHT